MNKKGFIQIIALIIVIFLVVVIIKTYNKNKTTPPIPKITPYITANLSDSQFEERYIRQAIIISNFFSSLSTVDNFNSKLEKLDAINKVIYAGSTIASALNFDSKLISSSTNLFSFAYTFRVAEYEINNIIPLYNNAVENSNLNEESTYQQAETYLESIGEFSGKSFYLMIRSKIDLVKGFISGVGSIIKKSGFKITDKDITKHCGTTCLSFVKVTNNEIIPKLINEIFPTIDKELYEFFGYLGKISTPILIKTTALTEDTLENEIKPKAKELANNFKQQIDTQIN